MPVTTPWIRSKRYDVALVFGGALFGVALPLLAPLAPATLLPVFLWTWLIFFEGSHFWATTSRSYLDEDFRRENPEALQRSLAFFALPLVAFGLSRALGSPMPKELYGFFIFAWSLYHVMRQHYGFVAIYQGKSRIEGFAQGTAFLYGRLIAATVVCGLTFTLLHRLPGQFGEAARVVPAGAVGAVRGAAAVLVLAVIASVWAAKRSDVSALARTYATVAMGFNLWVLVGVPAIEPLYPGASNFPQSILLFLVLNSIFHNTQYHAIVWHYRRQKAPSFGAYLAPALAFGAVFALLNYLDGKFPLPGGAVSSGALGDVAFVALTGIIGHHFYLDGKIWKVRASPSLKRSLALDPTTATAAVATAA